MVGESAQLREFKALLKRVATSPASTVLLTGESGTGKDLTAKILHYSSARAGRPFVNITCSALPETLLESELFGHERGAFTDARQQKKGLLEQADGGTVFLDEIGEMTAPLQAKLLRFLEEKTFRRVGGSADIRVDVRVIAATNRNLEDEVRHGRFREDLFYRLNVLPLKLPPLRAHLEDMPGARRASTSTSSTASSRRTCAARRRPRCGCSTGTAGPATSANCATPSSARCCSTTGDLLEPVDFPIAIDAGAAAHAVRAAGRRSRTSRRSRRASCARRSSAPAGIRRAPRSCSGLNRDQIHYRIEKFKLVAPDTRR